MRFGVRVAQRTDSSRDSSYNPVTANQPKAVHEPQAPHPASSGPGQPVGPVCHQCIGTGPQLLLRRPVSRPHTRQVQRRRHFLHPAAGQCHADQQDRPHARPARQRLPRLPGLPVQPLVRSGGQLLQSGQVPLPGHHLAGRRAQRRDEGAGRRARCRRRAAAGRPFRAAGTRGRTVRQDAQQLQRQWRRGHQQPVAQRSPAQLQGGGRSAVRLQPQLADAPGSRAVPRTRRTRRPRPGAGTDGESGRAIRGWRHLVAQRDDAGPPTNRWPTSPRRRWHPWPRPRQHRNRRR
jgi:hypothetical protein